MIFPLVFLAAAAATPGTPAVASPQPAVYAHHAISTADAQTQLMFDRGLTLFYAYNGAEGAHVFQAIEKREPNLAMGYWGEALCLGRDINTPLTRARFAAAHAAIERALALESGDTPEQERAYITAMRPRYAGNWSNRERDEAAYRTAMAAAVAENPRDNDLAALYAEALLENGGANRLWKSETSQPASSDTLTIVNALDGIIAREPAHIMANHLLIHVFEPSTDRTRALVAANRLNAMPFAPEDEHLAHMPAHTYIDLGQYQNAVDASRRALGLFDRYLAIPNVDPGHTDYIRHDTAVGFGAAMMLGNFAQADWFAQRLDASEKGTFYQMRAAMRFGRWVEVAKLLPKDPEPARIAKAYMLFQRGDAAGAKLELTGIRPDQNERSSMLLALRAAVAAANGDRPGAQKNFQKALSTEDDQYGGENLPSFPAGEIMGTAYYRLGDYAAAETAFRKTLNSYHSDPRALFGLAETLKKLGKNGEAQSAAEDFRAAWRGSDTQFSLQR